MTRGRLGKIFILLCFFSPILGSAEISFKNAFSKSFPIKNSIQTFQYLAENPHYSVHLRLMETLERYGTGKNQQGPISRVNLDLPFEKLETNEKIQILKSALNNPSHHLRKFAVLAGNRIMQEQPETARSLLPHYFRLPDSVLYPDSDRTQPRFVPFYLRRLYLRKEKTSDPLEKKKISAEIQRVKIKYGTASHFALDGVRSADPNKGIAAMAKVFNFPFSAETYHPNQLKEYKRRTGFEKYEENFSRYFSLLDFTHAGPEAIDLLNQAQGLNTGYLNSEAILAQILSISPKNLGKKGISFYLQFLPTGTGLSRNRNLYFNRPENQTRLFTKLQNGGEIGAMALAEAIKRAQTQKTTYQYGPLKDWNTQAALHSFQIAWESWIDEALAQKGDQQVEEFKQITARLEELYYKNYPPKVKTLALNSWRNGTLRWIQKSGPNRDLTQLIRNWAKHPITQSQAAILSSELFQLTHRKTGELCQHPDQAISDDVKQILSEIASSPSSRKAKEDRAKSAAIK